MISVYDRNEISFTHNGIVITDVISCIVEEELNGKYVLELEHPIDEKGKWKYLIEENIIKADGQLFRINFTEKDLYYIRVSARHIFYDLLHNFLEDVRPTDMNGTAALNWILDNTQYPHRFRGVSDIETINTQYYIRKNPVEAILGEDSLVTRWNGELERDNFTIRLLVQRGQNKGIQISYGKNLLGLEVKRDMDTVITRLMPIGRDGLMLPEKYVDSDLIDNYAYPYIKKVDFDIGVEEPTEDSEGITEEEAIERLREAAIEYMEESKCDIPYTNIRVNLLLLENTEEYKHLKNLVKVNLGDIVSCNDNPLEVTFESKVIRVKKDILTNRNIEVELGQPRKGIDDTVGNIIKDISEEIEHSSSSLREAIDRATERLTNALGGHVVKRPGELLIMDTEDIDTATKVWRWNLNGLGYSRNGIDGPYELAMTIDGEIVADFITTGVLDAGIVKTGVLKGGKVNFNLDSGTLLIGDNHSNYKLYFDGNDLNMNGNLTTYNRIGNKSVEMEGNSLKVFDWEGKTRINYVGEVTSRRRENDPSKVGVLLSHEEDAYCSITKHEPGVYIPYITFDDENIVKDSKQPITVHKGIFFRGDASLNEKAKITGYMANNRVLFEVSGDADEGFQMRTQRGTNIMSYIYRTNNKWRTIFYLPTTVQNDFFATGSIHTNGDLTASGSKNALVETKSFGKRLLNSYETPEYYFGDFGSGRISDDGLCYVNIEEIFKETINREVEYHVFLQKYGSGDLFLKERNKNYFIVEGTPGLEFAWSLTGKRLGYENHRLEMKYNFNFEEKQAININSINRIIEEVFEKEKEVERTLRNKIDFNLAQLLLEGDD